MATRLTDVRDFPRSGVDLDDDKSLVLAFQSGDIDAYSDIFVKYRALSAQICYRILQDREEADEAVQETMLRVYRGLGTFNGRYQLQAWVARIATNVALDMVRARARRPQRDPARHDISEDTGLVVGLTEDTSEVVERVLDREEVRSVLSSIPDHHREALVLREFEGRSHEEIGDALGVSPKQAKALIHRAKKSFRRAWTEGDERRGIAAFVPILLAPFRLPGLLRRIAQPAHDAVTSATATAQQAVTQVASNVVAAPAAAQTAMSAADRVTAVALTVMVAGTATVGAVAIRHATKSSSQASRTVAAAPAPSIAPAVIVAPLPVKASPAARRHARQQTQQGAAGGAAAVPTTIPSPSPSTSPSGSPSPSGSSTPPPPPPPAPPWTGSLDISGGLGVTHLALVGEPALSGHVGDSITFSETVMGRLLGPQGSRIGDVYVDFGGSATATGGSISSLWLFIDTPEGRYTYAANASVSSVAKEDDGSFTYVLSGQYSLDGLPATLKTEVPHDGQISIRLGFWQDGSLYATAVSMDET